jgi:non-heme chloroperoxidase
MKKFVTLQSGIRLEYVERGLPRGIPVVLLHGVTDSWRSFETVLPHLPSTLRVFALSLRGHGESTRPEGGYGYTDFAADVAGFMDAIGLSSAILVGHSMGSLVAQRFAVDHPERVSGLVLLGAFPTLYGDAEIAGFYESAVAPLTDPIDPDFARAWQLGTLARDIAPDYLDAVVDETLKVPARVWRAAFEGFLRTPDFTAELVGVAVPTLLLWGDRDTYASHAAQQRLLQAMPGAQLLVHHGAGHALHWEDPRRVARELTEFIYDRTATSPQWDAA